MAAARAIAERFWEKVNKTDSCWLWTAAKTTHGGHGSIGFNGRNHHAHRISWMLHVGDIPEGKHVLHTCDVAHCVNPRHLYIGTHQDNMRDAKERNRFRTVPRPGTLHHSVKLTECQVFEIRALCASGETTFVDIAKQYGVGDPTIHKIHRRQRWKHLDAPSPS